LGRSFHVQAELKIEKLVEFELTKVGKGRRGEAKITISYSRL
jgi:hypothetical protein